MKKSYFSGKIFLKNMVVVKIEVSYKTKKVKNLCTNLKKAKQKLGERISVELFSLVNLLRSAANLQDINAMQIYKMHALRGKMEGLYSLDIGGRKSSYRLIIAPIDATIEEKTNLVEFYSHVEIIRIEEVSKHYE